MEFVKDLGKPEYGGKCAKCEKAFNQKFLRKFLMEYHSKENPGNEPMPVTEPFIFCNSCALTVK